MYDRPKHQLKLADAIRILRSVNIYEETPADLLASADQLKISLIQVVQQAFTFNQFSRDHVISMVQWIVSLLNVIYGNAFRIANDLWDAVKAILKAMLG